MKYLQESGLRVPLSSQVSPPSQSPLEARGEALLRPGGGRGGPGLGGHGGVQAEDGGVRGAGGEEEEAAPPLDVALRGGEAGEDGPGYRAPQQHRDPREHGQSWLFLALCQDYILFYSGAR